MKNSLKMIVQYFAIYGVLSYCTVLYQTNYTVQMHQIMHLSTCLAHFSGFETLHKQVLLKSEKPLIMQEFKFTSDKQQILYTVYTYTLNPRTSKCSVDMNCRACLLMYLLELITDCDLKSENIPTSATPKYFALFNIALL